MRWPRRESRWHRYLLRRPWVGGLIGFVGFVVLIGAYEIFVREGDVHWVLLVATGLTIGAVNWFMLAQERRGEPVRDGEP